MFREFPQRGIDGFGDAFFLAASGSYNNFLTEMGIDRDKIFTSLPLAYNKMRDDQGDTLYILPGDHAVVAQLVWAKHNTHLVGLASGPNQRLGASTWVRGQTRVKCVTANIDSILRITGQYVQLHGFELFNNYSDSDNRADLIITSKNTYMNRIFCRGGNGANQLNHADAGVPIIFETGTAGAGNGFLAEECQFGSSGNSARTVGAGSMLFEGGAVAGFAAEFRKCKFEMRCETSGSTDPKLIHLANASYSLDRQLMLIDCDFYNFWENHAGLLDYAIVDACTTTHDIILKNCSMRGIDAWCNVATHCFTTIANAGSDGGKSLAVDTTP
jgi:hypothetical protein